MDTKEEIISRMKKEKVTVKNTKNTFIKNNISKLLLSIIMLFGILIFTNQNEDNKTLIQEHLLTNSMSFTTFNTLYETYFGSVAPSITTDEFVFSSELTYTNIKSMDSYEIITLSDSSIISALCGGIVVFVGDKDDLGYTVIVQGYDGYDIWYSNLENVSINLYDYIETEEILGEAIDKSLYLTIKNGTQIVDYETYKN